MISKYGIFKMHLKAKADVRIAQRSFWNRNKHKPKTLKIHRFNINEVYQPIVLECKNIENYINELTTNIDEYILWAIIENELLKDDYVVCYDKYPIQRIEKKISYEELNFNDYNINYWKENLESVDLLKILTQEQLNINKILLSK